MAESGTGRVAVTGATGFIGRHLVARLQARSPARLTALVRGEARLPPGVTPVPGDLRDPVSLDRLCAQTDIVFHCAGFAHALGGGDGFEREHGVVNFEGTRNLVEAAGRAGVRRFVHLSSVKAMAEPGDACVDEDHPGTPDSAYGKAKRAAEDAVLDGGRRYGMHVVNLRPAMVYGPGGTRGNLDRMARWIARGWFPPLPETGNRRSLIHVDDLVAAIELVALDARADGRTYIVADRNAYSGRGLYESLCNAMGITPKAWQVPRELLQTAGAAGDFAGRVLRRRMPLDSEVVARLLSSAWYSAARIERELGWCASTPLAYGLTRTYAPPSC